MEKNKDMISKRLDRLFEFSVARPETTFVIGTPLFKDKKPRNSALLIKNGEVVGLTSKRSGATEEENRYFDLIAEEAPLLIPGTKTALLICADMPTASLYAGCDKELLVETLRLSKRQHLIGKKVNFIPPLATSLLVIACWGVGGQWMREGKEDEYYRMQLRNVAWRMMRETKIKEVIMVDRSPNSLIKPYNGIIRLT